MLTCLTFPDLHIQQNNTVNVTEGENLVLHCITEGIPADITYSRWIHTGEFIPHRELEGEEATNDYILKINKVSYRDTGRYTCQADNRNYTEQRRSEVFIFCKLKIFITNAYYDLPCHTVAFTNVDYPSTLGIERISLPVLLLFSSEYAQNYNLLC